MPESLTVALASAVRMRRAERRLTQEDLAAVLGMGRATLADVEAGRRKVSVDDLETLCTALDTTFPALLALTARGREAARVLGL